MMSTLRRKLTTIAASTLLALGAGATSDAFAAGIFTVDPTSIAGTGTTFNADFVEGGSSARVLRNDSTNTYMSNGWIQFTGFLLGGNTVPTDSTKLDSTTGYGLYATFTQTFTCPSALAVGVQCDVTSIDLSLFADPGFADTFTLATLASNPTVTDAGSNDRLLANANVVIAGVAGVNSLGGAFENVNTNFILTAAGSSYFIAPVPFFNLAFSNFNNSSTGLTCDTNPAGGSCPGSPSILAINAENGGTQFLRAPEPGTLALAGLGMLVAGMARRRKK